MNNFLSVLISGLLLVPMSGFVSGCQARRAEKSGPIRVVVWDERQPEQKAAYGDFLGNAIARHLATRPGLSVISVGLDEPEQGLSARTLDECDVLIWWGHQKHGAIAPERVKAVVDRLQTGRLSLIALHSAHWSKPFIEAMNLRSIEDALKSVPKEKLNTIEVSTVPAPGGLPKKTDALTPSSELKTADGRETLIVRLPRCVFPIVRNEGKPSRVVTRLSNHPIAKGVPAEFEIPQTEVYAGPFHVPRPDALVFEEHWTPGESFASGCAWNVGKGKVFYFRPGHETYPIFTQEIPLRIVENAVRWAAPTGSAK